MLLSDGGIRRAVLSGELRVDPFDDALVQPASLDVRLDRYFRVFEHHQAACIDPAENQKLTRLVEVASGEPFILHPHEFALAATYEYIQVPVGLAARVEGKSSLGRLGLLTHSTAGWLDPGFDGHVTLELSNTAGLPIKLWPGMRIGQVCFFRLEHPAHAGYSGRYQGAERGPAESRSWKDFERWPKAS